MGNRVYWSCYMKQRFEPPQLLCDRDAVVTNVYRFLQAVEERKKVYMMITMPKELKENKKYLMQIVAASSEFQDYIPFTRYKFEFVIRIWSDVNNLKNFYDVTEVFYNNGRCAGYLVEFVENSTDCEFCSYDSDIEFAVGVAFIGIISIKNKVDCFGDTMTFYNIKALESLGYYAVEGEEEE